MTQIYRQANKNDWINQRVNIVKPLRVNMMADVVFLREDCCELVENMAAYADIEIVRPRQRCGVVYMQ